MGCSDSRAVSAISIAAAPENGKDDVRITEFDGVAEGLMDEDGAFYGGDGVDPGGYTLGEYVLEYLRKHAPTNKDAQVDGETDEPWSYRTLLRESVQVAAALSGQGLAPGDTAAFFSRNHHELYSAVLGSIVAGITVATMVPTHGPSELRYQLDLCEPKVLFVETELLERALEALKDCSYQVDVIILDGSDAREGLTAYASLAERDQAIAADPDTYPATPIEDNFTHVAFILYSSGTTGLPKGVQISNAALTNMIVNFGGLPAVPDGAVVSILSLAPISWISGVLLLLKSIQGGNRRVFMADPKERKVLTCLQKYKIQAWPTAPSVLLAFCSHPAVRFINLSNLKYIMSGGGPLSASLQTLAAKKLNCTVVQGYGSTEGGIVMSTSEKKNRPGAMGVADKQCRIRLIDLDTNEVVREPGRVGEMRVKSPYSMIGYIGNPEATAACYDEDGWFRSGDLMYFDSDGFFFFVDRLKEMIKYKAHQVAPTELEAVLVTHPAVKDACVLGLPHPVDGEWPAAFVVKNKASLTEKDVQDFIAEKLSDPKRLRGGVIFIDSIPRTTTGKTMRGLLKKKLIAHFNQEEE